MLGWTVLGQLPADYREASRGSNISLYTMVTMYCTHLAGDPKRKEWGSMEDCTLPRLFRRNPLDSNPGLCQCEKGQIGMFSLGGVDRNPVESAESNRLIPVDSTGLVQ
jgi:hypothetical protein